MMKPKIITYLLCILMFSTACNTKRHSLTASRQTAVTERSGRDSLVSQQLRLELQQRNTVLRHIRLTRPDSLGRQAVQSVTEITVEERSSCRDSVASQSVNQVEQRVALQTENRTETEKTVERKSGGWSSLLWMVVLSALTVVFLRRRR